VFPEMSIEHPPQCTGQGELTFENVALLMLSRFCKQRRMYLVLGSVEERGDNSMYDTCVVLDRDGEIIHFYRKQSTALHSKTAGTQPGIFDTEFGPIGILLGAEVEEEQRWQELLVRRPYLILNPARAPMQLDPVLIRTHPELQVNAWHKSLRHLEHVVETRTRSCACSFVRADAPFHEGGAGTSILVEPHRSVLAPRWGTAFFVVDTLHPYELEGRKLPGWRQLTVDERARAAMRDRALLTQEEIERGPRYLVWTLRPSTKGVLRTSGWNNATAQRDQLLCLDSMAELMISKPVSFLVPLLTKEGLKMLASISSKGEFILWDVKLKREIASSKLGATGLTAVNRWSGHNQIIMGSTNKGVTTLKIYEEHTPVASITLDNMSHSSGPRVTRFRRASSIGSRAAFGATMDPVSPASAFESPRSGHSMKTRKSVVGLDHGANPSRPTRTPPIRSLFHVCDATAVMVVDALDRQHGPTAALVDMEDGDVTSVDVFGNGAPEVVKDADSDDEDDEDKHLDRFGEKRVDKLVQSALVVQTVKGRQLRMLICLYDSHRLVQVPLTEGLGEIHEVLLHEDTGGDRKIVEIPICFSVLPNEQSDAYHLVVSYTTLMVRWWQVGLTAVKLQSQVTLTAAATHLAVFDWPVPVMTPQPPSLPRKTQCLPPVDKLPGGLGSSPRSHGHARKSMSTMSMGTTTTDKAHEQSPDSARGPGRASQSGASISLALLRGRPSVKSQHGHDGRRSILIVDGHRSSEHGRKKSVYGHRSSQVAAVNAQAVKGDEFLHTKDQSCLCIVAYDVNGAMPVFIARAGRIAKVYTCADFLTDKSAKVDQLICDGETIAVQTSAGDVRHIEFVFEDDVISLKNVPMDVPN